MFIFPGSGTGGWEAALTNTLSPGDKVLAARIGQFSHLWIDMCKRIGLDVVEVDGEWGEGVPVERFAEILAGDKAHQIKAVLVTHNETATGVTSDVAGVRARDGCREPPGAAVRRRRELDRQHRLPHGRVGRRRRGQRLAEGLHAADRPGHRGRQPEGAGRPQDRQAASAAIFDFADMIAANKDGYFPYTPATTLLRGLRCSVDLLLEEGLENVFARHHRLAEAVRRRWRPGASSCAPRRRNGTPTR